MTGTFSTRVDKSTGASSPLTPCSCNLSPHLLSRIATGTTSMALRSRFYDYRSKQSMPVYRVPMIYDRFQSCRVGW